MHKQVRKRLNEVDTRNDRLPLSAFDTFAGSQGSITRVASHKVELPIAVRQAVRTGVAPMAYESFTTDGNSDQDTFTLSHDIVQSEATSQNIVVYEGTSEESVDSVDYANDSFDYTDQGTGNDLHVFYAAGDQARLVFRVVGPNGVEKDLLELDAGLMHRRDAMEDPITFEFARALEGVVPSNFRLEQYIDAPYTAKYDHDTGSGTVDASNAILSVPVRRAESKIDGLGRAVRHDIAES